MNNIIYHLLKFKNEWRCTCTSPVHLHRLHREDLSSHIYVNIPTCCDITASSSAVTYALPRLLHILTSWTLLRRSHTESTVLMLSFKTLHLSCDVINFNYETNIGIHLYLFEELCTYMSILEPVCICLKNFVLIRLYRNTFVFV